MTSYPSLPPAVDADRHDLDSVAGRLSYYSDDSGPDARPLLLVHSVNAAASAYEMRPLFRHYRRSRPTYALELPGFGHAERSERRYTPRLMTDAVTAMVDTIRERHGDQPIDALALSLGAEFLARAASEQPRRFRRLGLISPTGFDRRAPLCEAPGSHAGKPWLYRAVRFPLWDKALFNALVTRVSIRFFLKKTWGSKHIDEGLLEYDYLSAHRPGARYAVYHFVSGFLFSQDITRVYQSLDQPVWMSHGVRGDFVDYRHKTAYQDLDNWHFQQFDSGAMPHFELAEQFLDGCDRFLTEP